MRLLHNVAGKDFVGHIIGRVHVYSRILRAHIVGATAAVLK